MKHYPVMLDEVINYLSLDEDSVVVDATLGAAGHSSSILKRIKRGFLFAFEQDSEVIEESRKKLSSLGNNFTIIDSNFRYMKEELRKRNINKVDAILFDLGTSSMQLDNIDRGFNYHEDAKLDMRMDRRNPLTAEDVVNTYSLEDLTKILRENADEKYAYQIAKKIIEKREIKRIETTLELVEIIKEATPYRYKDKKHPARKTFQAIRVEVNKELDILKDSLINAASLLKVGGRLLVITFQSKEDIIVKRLFNELTKEDEVTKGDPNLIPAFQPSFKNIKRLKASKKEIDENYRSRSAILRVIERIRD